MADRQREPLSAEIERVKRATAHHFSVTYGEGDVPGLIRKVADAIEELGEIDVHDITFCTELEDGTDAVTMTVYLSFPGD